MKVHGSLITQLMYSIAKIPWRYKWRTGSELINGGTSDLVGIWAPSNIRIGVSYAVHDRLTLGFGTSKFDVLQDFNWKVALLRQTRGNEMPVSVSYYGNFTIDADNKQTILPETRIAIPFFIR